LFSLSWLLSAAGTGSALGFIFGDRLAGLGAVGVDGAAIR